MKYIFNTLFESEENNYEQFTFGAGQKVLFEDEKLYKIKYDREQVFNVEITTLTNDDKTIQEQIEYLLNKGILEEVKE